MTSRLAAALAVPAVALTVTVAACGSSTPARTNVPVHRVPSGQTSGNPVDSTSPVAPGTVQPKPSGAVAATFGADSALKGRDEGYKFAQLGMADATLITKVPAARDFDVFLPYLTPAARPGFEKAVADRKTNPGPLGALITYLSVATPGVTYHAPYFVDQKYSPASLDIDSYQGRPRLRVTFQVNETLLYTDHGMNKKVPIGRSLSLEMVPTGAPGHPWQIEAYAGQFKGGDPVNEQ